MRVDDFKKLTGWVDYDRPLLRREKLTKSQEIRYFQKRIRMILLTPLKEMYRSLMKRKKLSSTIVCFGTCICCSIEALGKFHTGKLGTRQSGKNFRSFVKAYMNNDFSKILSGESYVNILWTSFRNGLAHGFTIKNGGFEHHRFYFQIKSIGGIDVLEIDPTSFYNDFKNAIDKFINSLKQASTTDKVYINFHKAFDHIFVQGK